MMVGGESLEEDKFKGDKRAKKQGKTCYAVPLWPKRNHM